MFFAQAFRARSKRESTGILPGMSLRGAEADGKGPHGEFSNKQSIAKGRNGYVEWGSDEGSVSQ